MSRKNVSRMGNCSVRGCNNPIKSSRLCEGHYKRKQRYGDPLAGTPVPRKGICKNCGNRKPLEGRKLVCRDCKLKYAREYARDHRHQRALARARKLYGPEGELLEHRRQRGDGCDVCGQRVEPMHIDHCHTTGTVRGLLCPTCNLVLGSVRDDPDMLRRLADYVSRQE